MDTSPDGFLNSFMYEQKEKTPIRLDRFPGRREKRRGQYSGMVGLIFRMGPNREERRFGEVQTGRAKRDNEIFGDDDPEVGY